MQKLNYFIGIISVIAQSVISIMYHFGRIDNANTAILIVAIFTGVAFIIANSINNWFKGVTIAILAFIITFGFGKFAIMCGYVGTYTVAQTNNLIQINNISKEEDFKKIMSYNGKDYYVDNGYTYLYSIERNGLFSSIEANSIMIDVDAESIFNGRFGEFYEINNNEYFSNIDNVRVAIALIKDSSDNSVFIKLINEDHKVFYSYLVIDHPSELLNNIGVIQSTIQVGAVELLITKPSKIIDGTVDTNGELNYVDGKQYIITAGTRMYLSELSVVTFEEDGGYYNRINYYIYKEYFNEIEKYQTELDKLNPDTDEYKEIKSYIENLEKSMSSYSCELCYEIVQPDRTVRIYRAFIKDGQLEIVPNLNIIEIEYETHFVFATTEITLDELK
jgi:hypothetical protein